MILQVHTEKELIGLVESLKKEVGQLRTQNKEAAKRIDILEYNTDKNPEIKIKQPLTLNESDVSNLINKHVTLVYVNKLYGR